MPIHTHCLNCGAELQGTYCSRCGQRDAELKVPFSHVLEEVFHDVWHFDLRFLGTLRLLLTRPGQLTVEYMAGRRTRFLPPFRLYVFVSFVLFLLLGVSGARVRNNLAKPRSGVVTLNLIVDTPATAPQAGAGAQPLEAGSHGDSSQRGLALKHGIEAAVKDPEAFVSNLLHWVSRVMFLLLPAFAGLLQLTFFRSRKFFTEHVVFSLHCHAYVFVLFILEWVLNQMPWGWTSLAGGLLNFTIPVYLGVALKRVYAPSMGKLLLKGAVLSAVYGLLVGLSLLGVTVWTVTHGAH